MLTLKGLLVENPPLTVGRQINCRNPPVIGVAGVTQPAEGGLPPGPAELPGEARPQQHLQPGPVGGDGRGGWGGRVRLDALLDVPAWHSAGAGAAGWPWETGAAHLPGQRLPLLLWVSLAT